MTNKSIEQLLEQANLLLNSDTLISESFYDPLILFHYEVVTVDRTGDVIKKKWHQNCYFQEDLGNGIFLEMVYIPGGTFWMGSEENDKGRYYDEIPQHQVTIQPFFIGKYPITIAQWRFVANLPKIEIDLKASPSEFQGDDRRDPCGEVGNRPVERVSWHDAVEFCARLSNLTGIHYSLPTESQWEYSCRARTTSPFHYGETITNNLANYDTNYTYADEAEGQYRQETTEVGSFLPNAFGLYDMHGNVWEWCLDNSHDHYKGAPNDGTAWLESNHTTTVMRGGSWDYNPRNCRSAYRRFYDSRFLICNNIGFRVQCGRRQS